MLPGHLVEDFWDSVIRELESQKKVSPAQGREAIGRFREKMGSHGAEEAIYHWEPRDIARTIINGGFLG